MVTYNFDPDRWYDRELTALEHRLRRGEIGEQEFERKKADIEHRYEDMLRRLDGTYDIPR